MFLPFDNETLSALEASHGSIRVVRGATPPVKRWNPDATPEPPWEAVFREPTTGEGDNFEGAVHNDRTKAGALRNHAKATVVAVSHGGKHTICSDRRDKPAEKATREAWDDLRRTFPGAHMAAQDDLMSLAGMAKDEEGKE